MGLFTSWTVRRRLRRVLLAKAEAECMDGGKHMARKLRRMKKMLGSEQLVLRIVGPVLLQEHRAFRNWDGVEQAIDEAVMRRGRVDRP